MRVSEFQNTFFSGDFAHARNGNRGLGKVRPCVLGGAQPLLAVEAIIPAERLSGVGCHAAHHANHRAIAHVMAVVDWLTGANALKEMLVLDTIHTRFGAAIAPCLALLGADLVSQDFCLSLGAQHELIDMRRGVILLPAGESRRSVPSGTYRRR